MTAQVKLFHNFMITFKKTRRGVKVSPIDYLQLSKPKKNAFTLIALKFNAKSCKKGNARKMLFAHSIFRYIFVAIQNKNWQSNIRCHKSIAVCCFFACKIGDCKIAGLVLLQKKFAFSPTKYLCDSFSYTLKTNQIAVHVLHLVSQLLYKDTFHYCLETVSVPFVRSLRSFLSVSIRVKREPINTDLTKPHSMLRVSIQQQRVA